MNIEQMHGSGAQCRMRFSCKAIAVTGGGTGIGLQIASDLHAEGAAVHIHGRSEDRLKEAKELIAPGESEFFFQKCDVSNYDEAQDVFHLVRNVSDNLFGLINNAAINPSKNEVPHNDSRDWIKHWM